MIERENNTKYLQLLVNPSLFLERLVGVGLLLLLLLSCSHDDDTTTPASEAEKEIASVAFFALTAGGEFSKYLSTETLNSEHGLPVALSGSSGSYRAPVKIKANNFPGATLIIVICNHAENGLTDKLLSVNTLDKLQSLQSNIIADNEAMPQSPLLMYDYKTNINLMAESLTNITFDLKIVTNNQMSIYTRNSLYRSTSTFSVMVTA